MSIAEWYDHSTYPIQGSSGTSSAARAEFEAIQNGLSAKLCDLVGNGGKYLKVKSTEDGVEAVTATVATGIIQVVSATYAVSVTSSTSTLVDTGLSATITPSSVTNKILVIVFQAGCNKETGNTGLQLKLLRGASALATFEDNAAYTNNTDRNMIGACGITYLDSPGVTSATTYKTQIASKQNTAIVEAQSGSAVSSIVLMEVVP